MYFYFHIWLGFSLTSSTLFLGCKVHYSNCNCLRSLDEVDYPRVWREADAGKDIIILLG